MLSRQITLLPCVRWSRTVARAARAGAFRGLGHGAVSTRRPILIGVVHGASGTAALTLLVGSTIPDRAETMAFIVLFGLASIVEDPRGDRLLRFQPGSLIESLPRIENEEIRLVVWRAIDHLSPTGGVALTETLQSPLAGGGAEPPRRQFAGKGGDRPPSRPSAVNAGCRARRASLQPG